MLYLVSLCHRAQGAQQDFSQRQVVVASSHMQTGVPRLHPNRCLVYLIMIQQVLWKIMANYLTAHSRAQEGQSDCNISYLGNWLETRKMGTNQICKPLIKRQRKNSKWKIQAYSLSIVILNRASNKRLSLKMSHFDGSTNPSKHNLYLDFISSTLHTREHCQSFNLYTFWADSFMTIFWSDIWCLG